MRDDTDVIGDQRDETVRRAVVYGATGHTGRMVAATLHERGWRLTLSGRSRAPLEELAATLDAEARVASVGSPASLDEAVAGADVVINCAGPFRDTAPPLIAAALRVGVAYIDVAAEIETIVEVVETWDGPARDAGVAVVPAMGFFGGLGALVAAEALGSWRDADRITVDYGLNEWVPTAGTLAAGAASRERRQPGTRPVFTGGELSYTDRPAVTVERDFPAPLGRQPAVAELTMADTVTIARYAEVDEMVSYMTAEALAGLGAGTIRSASDAGSPSSPQRFVLRASAFRGDAERRCTVRGGDIYAITAPLVAHTAALVVGSDTGGVLTAPELASAGSFLRALGADLEVEPPEPGA